MDRAKRRLVSALDGFRNQHKSEMDLDEKITAENVCLTGIVRHGFPDDPRCMAYDTVQRLLAIGTGHGVIRIIGGIGVDYCLKHESDAAVLHIQFLMNEWLFDEQRYNLRPRARALVTACYDDLIHLWNFRQKVPGVLHSIQLTKEQITCISHSFQNKWLYLGTERGNVYFINIATFTLSNYTINWNKAIDLGVRTHPGSVKAISTCPTELSKLLLLYEKGMVVLWNLQTKEVDRFISDHPARCFAWHHDGRQFMCGTADGFLLIWNTRKPEEYAQKLQPHGQKCSPITQVDWKHSSDGEQLIVFSGGMSLETDLLPALTIMRASKSVTVLELDHPLITFASLNASPYSSVSQQPSSVAILMKHDLLVIDLTIPGYPCHENVSPMDIHESRVRCIYYFSNCPLDLLGALALVGSKQRRQGFSNKPWPITGGNGRDCAMGHQELLLTGHEDGSIKFWQASGEHLQILYKLKSGRHFEGNEGLESHQTSHAVTMIELCLDSRLLLVAGQSGQLTLFRFVKTENAHEITRQGTAISVESNSTDTSEGSTHDGYFPLKVRGGVLRKFAGYQPDLVCMIPWRNISQPETITAMALNSAYGIIALGTSMSLTLIDLVQYVIICSWSVADLYVSQHSTPILLSQNSNSSQYDTNAMYPGNVSPTCTIPEVVKSISPILLRPSNKLSSRQKIFKHVSLRKAFLTHTIDGSDKMKMMEAIATENRKTLKYGHFSLHIFGRGKYPPMEAKIRDGNASVESNKIRGKIRKKFKRRKTLVRSLTVHVAAAYDEQSKSTLSKIMLGLVNIFIKLAKHTQRRKDESSGSCYLYAYVLCRYSIYNNNNYFYSYTVVTNRCGMNTKRNMDSPPVFVSSKPILRGNTDISHLRPDRRPQLLKSQSIVDSGCEINDSSIAKTSSADESSSCTNKMVFSENPRAYLCLWVGTSTSTCIIYYLLLPADRLNSTVSVAHSGSIVQTHGRVLYTTLMDQNFCLLGLAVLVSEDEVHAVALPNFNSLFLYRPEFPFIKARATHVHGYPVLMLLNGAGQIVILSLPSLRLLLCSNLFRHSIDYDDPLCLKTSFAEHGLGIYMITPSEMSRREEHKVEDPEIHSLLELANQVQESAGELFVPIDTPEPPKIHF
ncbi:STB5L [Dirofilaria immitis]|nr:STB5L [Dirofilaria immitis]